MVSKRWGKGRLEKKGTEHPRKSEEIKCCKNVNF